MLWALCGRISNYGDNGPLGYVLSSCGSQSQDFCTFIRFDLSLLWWEWFGFGILEDVHAGVVVRPVQVEFGQGRQASAGR